MTKDLALWVSGLMVELEARVRLDVGDVGGLDDLIDKHYPNPVSEVVDWIVQKYGLEEVT